MKKQHLILAIILSVTFLLRFPTLFEPLWYTDEAIYLTIGQKILRGGMMYVDIFDHKTPGIYYLTAGALGILGQSVWSIKFLLTIWVLATLVVFYLLGRRLFNEKIALVATIIFSVLTSLPIIEGNAFNSEILMILPISLGILFGLDKKFFLSGVFFSLAFILKVPAVFDFAAFFVFVGLTISKKDIAQTIPNLLKLAGGFVIPIFLATTYFALNGAFGQFFESAFLYNISYTGYGNKFIVENGLLLIKALPIVLIVLYSIFRINRGLKTKGGAPITAKEFLIIWLVFSFYGAVFGGRLYEHYLIQALPAFSLITAVSCYDKKFRRTGFILVTVILVLSSALGFRPWFNSSYYTNFFQYVTNRTSFDTYAAGFDKKTPKNYAIASFLAGCEKYNSNKKCIQTRTRKDDKLFVYANLPDIYFLSGLDPASRYITYLHLFDSQKAQEVAAGEVEKSKPKYILVQNPPPGSFDALVKVLSDHYNLFASYEDMDIYKINKPPSR
ncbi:MAG TPA: glycosyltransferase family 39 protein [Candidatus Nanoarchaeia archaeon]